MFLFFVQKATSGVYKVLGDQARRHPDRIVGDPFTLSAKLETGRYAYPFVRELKNSNSQLTDFSFFSILASHFQHRIRRFAI